MQKIIKEMIDTYVNNLISESLTPIVYHFCDLNALYGICTYNKFILTSSNTNKSDINLSKRGEYQYPYYICFSRTKSPDVGYPSQRLLKSNSWQVCLVRLEIDGEKLNYLYKAHPVNYYVNDDDPKIQVYSQGLNKNVDYKQIARQQMYEYEDRLLSNRPVINNANKYIKRIDILIKPLALKNGNYSRIISKIGQLINLEPNKIFIYVDKNAFNKSDDRKALSHQLFLNGQQQNTMQLQLTTTLLKPIASLINIVCFSETQNVQVKKTLIKKYGFGEYMEELLYLCNTKEATITTENINSQLSFVSMCKPNFKRSSNWRYVVLMEEMLNDYIKSCGISYGDICNYKKSKYNLVHGYPLNKKQLVFKEKCEENIQQFAFNNFLKVNNKNIKDV